MRVLICLLLNSPRKLSLDLTWEYSLQVGTSSRTNPGIRETNWLKTSYFFVINIIESYLIILDVVKELFSCLQEPAIHPQGQDINLSTRP